MRTEALRPTFTVAFVAVNERVLLRIRLDFKKLDFDMKYIFYEGNLS